MTKNLLLVSLDTLRADVAYSGAFPTISSLQARGTSFLTTVSSSPLTPVSHATVLTGLQPARHGIRHLLRERLDPHVATMATVVKDAGYTTAAFVSCPGLNRWYGLDRGFDHYDDWIPPLADGRDAVAVADVQLRGTALKRAPEVVDRAIEWLRNAPPKPLFVFIHFFDSHWPYEPPCDVGVECRNPYEGEVAYMDNHLGRFLDAASHLGLAAEETLTVCFSDHGEDLAGWYDNDHAGDDRWREERGHGALLFDATQMVPLVIAAADGGVGGSEVSAQTRLVDVFPTVVELLGLPAVPADGESLAAAIRGDTIDERPAYCETFYREELAAMEQEWSHLRPLQAIRQGGRKTVWEHAGDVVELYDLREDPLERSPLRLSGRG